MKDITPKEVGSSSKARGVDLSLNCVPVPYDLLGLRLLLFLLTHDGPPILTNGARRYENRIGVYSHNFDHPQEREISSDSVPLFLLARELSDPHILPSCSPNVQGGVQGWI